MYELRSDPDNVHDSILLKSARKVYDKIRIENYPFVKIFTYIYEYLDFYHETYIKIVNDFSAIEYITYLEFDIKNDPIKILEINGYLSDMKDLLNRVIEFKSRYQIDDIYVKCDTCVSVLIQIYNMNKYITCFNDTEQNIVGSIFNRIEAKCNDFNRIQLIIAFIENMYDCMQGTSILCEIGRMLNMLNTLYLDNENICNLVSGPLLVNHIKQNELSIYKNNFDELNLELYNDYLNYINIDKYEDALITYIKKKLIDKYDTLISTSNIDNIIKYLRSAL
jgi:hypothetical protein